MASPSGTDPRTALLARRVWLPRWLYEALPLLYLALGGAALAAAVIVEDPAWVVPLALVLAVGTTHLGLWIATLRYRRRRRAADATRSATGLMSSWPAP